MILDEQTRTKIQQENTLKAISLDTKQHCQKILQGIEKFDENTSKRAIWELVQNARDLARKGPDGEYYVNIQIELAEDYLSFSHDGKHFSFDSLTPLIKQVSSEEKDDPDAAGEFGTGFMTTHKFSRVLKIYGSYEIEPNIYVPLDGFMIDRSSDNLPGMRKAMEEQLNEVNELLYKETCEEEKWTRFVYEIDNDERRAAAVDGVNAAIQLMPYVMTFNERIESCKIIEKDGTETLFKKGEVEEIDGLYVMHIWRNETPIDCYYLQSEDGNDIIILPLETSKRAKPIGDIPRLFIYFPLFGTGLNTINYIYHSKRFFPAEPRDLIVLPDGNIEHQAKIDRDVQVLKSMNEMLFNYLMEHATSIENSIYLAPIGFDMKPRREKTMAFFDECHKEWVDVFKNLPLIELKEEHVSIEQSDKVKVLDHSIVEFLKTEGNEKYLDVVYKYANKVSALPKKEEIIEWSDIVYNWDINKTDWYVKVEDIVGKIAGGDDKEELVDFLMYLKESGQKDFLRTKAIIPNIEGVLRPASDLRNGQNIPDILYSVAKRLVPEFTGMLVDDAYLKVYDDWTSPSRDDLKTALSSFVDKEEAKEKPFEECLMDVLNFCMTFPTQNTTNTRYQAMEVLCRMHDSQMILNYVPAIAGEVDKEQLMYNVVFDSLVKWQFKQIENSALSSPEWYKDNGDILYALLNALSNKERPTAYQKIMQDYSIFPNQNGHLCQWDKLHILEDKVKEGDVKDICDYYIKVLGDDIRESWVEERFAWMETFGKDKIKENIAIPIDDKLQEGKYKSEVTLDIIKHLDSGDELWKEWFSNIEKNKAEIFLHRIDEKDLPNVYTILKDKEKIGPLAELASNPKMGEIIAEGKRVVAQKDFESRHKAFIKELGDFVEHALLEELMGSIDDKDLFVEVCDEQGGQDYIIKVRGEGIYYVEVKSRWSTEDSVEMSALQFKTSVEQKERYSLCVVDMTWKGANNIEDRQYDDVEKCKEHTKVLNDIGYRNEWCLPSVEKTDTKTHIGGSYCLVVPQSLVKPEGTPDFDSLIDRIKNIICSELKKSHEFK